MKEKVEAFGVVPVVVISKSFNNFGVGSTYQCCFSPFNHSTVHLPTVYFTIHLSQQHLGRGTSHQEGYALAGAVLETLCGWTKTRYEDKDTLDGLGCRTLFATHYHDLLKPVVAEAEAQTDTVSKT